MPFLVIGLAVFVTQPAAHAQTRPQTDTGPPASGNRAFGSGQALQLYKTCVLQSVVAACSSLIEQGKTPGVTNAYSVAAAHYKRGSIMAQREQLDAALSDYKAAATLFPFPQLDLEIARIENKLRSKTKPTTARPESNVVQKKPPKTVAKSPPQRAGRLSTKPKTNSPRTAERQTTPSTPRSTPQPVRPATPNRVAEQAANNQPKLLPKASPTAVPGSQVSISTIASSPEPWETITERVIHRYRARASRQAARPVSRIFTELRGSCEPAAGSECTPRPEEWLIADADFASALQHETELGRDKPTPTTPYANLAKGSLPSFKAMSGLRPAPPVVEKARPSPPGNPASDVKTKPKTAPQPAKFTMIARPGLVLPKATERPRWGPSMLHVVVLLIICSVSVGWVFLRRQRLGQLVASVRGGNDMRADDGVSPYATPMPHAQVSDLDSVERDIAPSGFETPPPIPESWRSGTTAAAETAGSATPQSRIADNVVEQTQIDLAEPLVSMDDRHLAERLAAELTQAGAEIDEVQQADSTPVDSESNDKELERAQLDGSILIVASDGSRRQRLLRATLKAAANDGDSSLRPMIALDSTGALEELLGADERYNDDLTIIDWNKPEFAGSLNPFSVKGLKEEPLAREQALNKAFEIQCHISEGVLGAELVAQSRSQLRHLFRLMSVVPGADYAKLRELLVKRDASRYESDIKFLNSKSSQAFFADEFKGRGFEKVATSLVGKLDDLLADRVVARAVLEPKDRKARRGKADPLSSIVVVPIPSGQLNATANSVMHRACLIRVMQHWPLRKTQSGAPNNTTLVIDSLSHFELPDLLGFNQILREFIQSGRRIIACVSDPADLPAGDCELVARHCSSKIIDGSLASQVQSLSSKLGLGDAMLEAQSWDETEDQALLLRSSEAGEAAVIVSYT